MNLNEKKNSIIAFVLIVTTVSMPLGFIPKKASAQSITGFVSGLAPAIVSLPQCKEIINSGIQSLFGGISTLIGDESIADVPGDPTFTPPDYAANPEPLEEFADSAGSRSESIDTHDSATFKEVAKQGKKLSKIEKATESLNANSTCIESIGRLIIKTLLQKLTVSTVAWINSGFDGAPAYLKEPGRFFEQIAKDEILQFGMEIRDPKLFPFGKIWMQNTVAAFNSKFQDNAQYSLNELIQNTTPEYSDITFREDFSQGGWNAWNALTQVPANNPLGFKLMADNEIQKRLAGTDQSTAEYVHDALKEADGFLGDQRCIEPKGITREEDRAGNIERAAKVNGPFQHEICEGGWEYVTPGKLISEAATTAINYENNAYLNVTDLNDAVAAILDALLAQFSTNIQEKGFANAGDQGSTGGYIYNTGTGYNPKYQTQTQKDFIPSQLSSSWLRANPNFDIRKDLTQALIDEQRTYSDKLKLQNEKLLSTTDGREYTIGANGVSNASGLMPAIYQLDYCIPGPHPDWENDARRTLNLAMGPILPETQQSLEEFDAGDIGNLVKSFAPAIGSAVGLALVTGTGASAVIFGATLGSFAPVLGTIVGAVIGLLIGFLGGLFGSDDFYNVRLYYATVINSLTGIMPNYALENDSYALNIMSKSGITNVMNTILDRYVRIMKKTYFASPEILPNVTREASILFRQLPGYSRMIEDNNFKIAQIKTTVELLGKIKEGVADLGGAGGFDEDGLKAQINAFGRLSAGMVNGDDIAKADNLLKQIIDKTDYVYKNLIKGPYGCEADLMKPQQNFPPVAGVLEAGNNWSNQSAVSIKRMTYPFPIIYDYNNFARGTAIPNPVAWDSDGPATLNTIPATLNPDLGPGFLSFVFFGTHPDERGGGPERLKISDLVPTGDEVPSHNYRRLGSSNEPVNPDINFAATGKFESLIGIY